MAMLVQPESLRAYVFIFLHNVLLRAANMTLRIIVIFKGTPFYVCPPNTVEVHRAPRK